MPVKSKIREILDFKTETKTKSKMLIDKLITITLKNKLNPTIHNIRYQILFGFIKNHPNIYD